MTGMYIAIEEPAYVLVSLIILCYVLCCMVYLRVICLDFS